MVLRSCSSLATSSFWPARVDTASVSWICSSAQRTARQSQACHPGGPKPQTVPRGHQRAEKPPPGAAEPTQSSDPVLSLRLGAAGHQQSLLSTRVQPSLVMPQGGHSPQDGAVPRSSARGNGSRQLPALAQLLQSTSKVFLVPRGTWQHPGWAEQGDLERMRGAEPIN